MTQVIYAPARIFDLAFGFCGVPSTRIIGPFMLAVELQAAASVSTFIGGGTFDPSFRRPLNTLDMLTSRWSTLRGLDSVRRSPASCSRETERERERDCDCTALLLFGSGFIRRSAGPWTRSSLLVTSESESESDVHCGIRKSFLRKSLYWSGRIWANLTWESQTI